MTLCLIPSAQVRDAKHADLNFQIEGAGGARLINISHRQGGSDRIENGLLTYTNRTPGRLIVGRQHTAISWMCPQLQR